MSEINLDKPYFLMTENGFFQVKKLLKTEKLLRRKELYELNLDYYNKGNSDYYKKKLSDDDLKKIDKAIHSKNSNSEIYLWEENGPESYSVVMYQSCLSIAVDELVELKKDKSSIIESETSAVTESAFLDNDIQLKSTLDDIRNKYEKYYNYITHLKSEESVAVFQYDNKITALNKLKEILDNNNAPQSKLNEIYKLINGNALDVLSKADNMGERFVKGIQMALNPLLKTFGIQLWKDRLKEIKALSTVSPLILDKPSSGSSAIEQDWQRAASNHEEVSVSINDKKLSDYAEKFNEFNTSNDLKNFFSEVILKEVNLTDEARENAMDYLMTTFHQGGLLHPVSSALFSFVKNSEKGMVSDSGFKRSVHIKTTESGFTVSEESNVKKIFIYENTGKNTQTISPESTRSPFVIKAEGKIDLDFLSNQGKNPVITVEKNKINYVDERITDLFTIKDSVEAETNSGSLRPNAGK